MEELRRKKGFICDMDGVIYHGNRLLPGVKEFVEWLYREQKNFLFLRYPPMEWYVDGSNVYTLIKEEMMDAYKNFTSNYDRLFGKE